MRITDNIQNVTGSFVLYLNRTNNKISNNEITKMEIDVRADVLDNSGIKNRSCVIERLKFSDIKAEYSVHKATNRIIIKLYNQKDGKLIREIPAVKMLDLAADIMESAGILLDARV